MRPERYDYRIEYREELERPVNGPRIDSRGDRIRRFEGSEKTEGIPEKFRRD